MKHHKSIKNPYLTPSRILATAKSVEGETSFSPFSIEVSSSVEVALRPGLTSEKRSVLAVQRTMTLETPDLALKSRMSARI